MVLADHFLLFSGRRRRTIWIACTACYPRGHGRDFQGAPLGAAVAAVVLDIGSRYLAPGQGGELGVQAGLVALDGDQVVRAALNEQVLGVRALGMQRVRGNHRAGEVDVILWGSNIRSWR